MDYYIKGGKHLVSRVNCSDCLKESVRKAIDMIGGIKKIIKKGDKILIKPNYNSDDPFPASSDPKFVAEVIKLLYANGATNVEIGESSGPYWKPTMKVLKRTGILEVAKELNVKVHSFDKEKWVKVDINGPNLKKVHIAKSVLEADKIIYLPCMKTHKSAKFTMSLKLTMGLIRNIDRYKMHARMLEEKIGDINLAVKPALIVMDGRKCFVTDGPSFGKIEHPNVIMASGDRVAIDAEAVKILQSYNAKNKVHMDVWGLPQIKSAVKLKIGSKSEKDYKVLG